MKRVLITNYSLPTQLMRYYFSFRKLKTLPKRKCIALSHKILQSLLGCIK